MTQVQSAYVSGNGLGGFSSILGAVGQVAQTTSNAITGADLKQIRAQENRTQAQLEIARLSAGNTKYIVGGLIATTLIGGSIYAFTRRKKKIKSS